MKGKQGYGRARRDTAIDQRAKEKAQAEGVEASFADHLIAWM